MDINSYCQEIKEDIENYAKLSTSNSYKDNFLYTKYDVKRGLRDANGKGVVTGLTNISDVIAFKNNEETGEKEPCEGELYYRGYKIEDLIEGFLAEDRFGFEEIIYLLLIGRLPKKDEYEHFKEILANLRTLPASFVRDIILKKPSKDMMNVLARCVLSMYPYDDNPDDLSIENLIEQSLKLIAQFPLMSVYGYNAYIHYHDEASLIIHQPSKDLSTAENILHCLRPDSSYTKLEARLLDICLILHAEHGGGNNSTFTTHVVSSSGTDTYSTIAAALGSLKGPKHGGANIKVVKMFDDMKATLKEDYSDEKVNQYLNDLLDRKAFDGSGLIYGMGHAVYTKSDPRAKVLKRFIKSLAEEKNLQKDYELYKQVERLAPEIINDKRKIYKGVSANIDFYSGFVYKMLDIPVELYTPIFAIARVVGWCSHRIEEIVNSGKIIRPAYIYTAEHLDYKPIAER